MDIGWNNKRDLKENKERDGNKREEVIVMTW